MHRKLNQALISLREALGYTGEPVFVYIGGIPGAIALMFVGICVVGTFGVTMVLSQVYLPRHVGMASGPSVGLAMRTAASRPSSSAPSPIPST
jgi:hypothetical protein